MSDLRVWVSDKLHDVAGISDMTIADFFVGLAGKSSSADDLIEKIRDTQTLDVDPKVTSFAHELFGRIPKAASSHSHARKLENRAKERAAMELEAKNRSYKMIQVDESDEERPKVKKKKKKKAKSESEEEDAFDKMERERQKDKEERDAYAQRLIKKDKDKQRNRIKDNDKGYEEAAKRLAVESENREAALPDLRKKSRREYLNKRKADKIAELKDDIVDDEFLFDESQLTQREKLERKYKKTVMKLVNEHDKAG